MNYRPSKSFVISMAGLCPLVVALIFGLLPELEAMRNPPIRGEITFSKERSVFKAKGAVSSRGSASFGESMDRLLDSYEGLMAWDKNPWKIQRPRFGNHYLQLAGSKDPLDIARAKEIRRLADALLQRFLERCPELASAHKQVPPERNGFLKLMELWERLDPKNTKSAAIPFPEDIRKQLGGELPWDAERVRAWLAKEKPLIDEIRAIGLLPEQSVEGIDVHRWSFIPARFAKNCTDALLMESRLAAADGDVSGALESIQAANGIAEHLGNVETPSLLATTVQIVILADVQRRALTEIMPALPAGKLDPEAWENAVNPMVSSPAEFARIMKGEWNITAREYIFPMVSDTKDPKYPPDPEALIEYYSAPFIDVARKYEGRPITDLPNIELPEPYDNSHLSRSSRQLTDMLFVGCQAWRKGWDRAQSAAAMTQAAFAIIKGQPIPNDPIYGQSYHWDPATRTLSPPNTEVFQKLDLKPIIVPKP